MTPFGPDDLDYVDLVETDADRAFQPRPNCCEDCDEAIEAIEFAAITAQFDSVEVQQ